MLRQRHLKAILLILVLGVITYFNAFANRFVWDDRALIIENELIRDWKCIPQIFTAELYRTSAPGSFYRPVQTLSYLFDHSIWQINPYGYHFTNLLIHIVNGILVYFIVLFSLNPSSKLFPSPSPLPQGERIKVREISILFKLFKPEEYFIALFTALLFMVHPVHVQAVTYISGRADLLACLFLLITFILFMKGETFLSRIVSSLSFIFALLSKEAAIIFPIVVLAWVSLQRKRNYGKAEKRELRPPSVVPFFVIAIMYLVLRMTALRFSDKILPQDLSLNFGTSLLTSFKTLTSYIRLLLSPFELHPEYMVEPVRSFFTIDFLISLVVIVVIATLLVWAYRDERTLFKKTTESSPKSYRAHFNLGVAYYNAGLYNEAIIEFRNALELNPESIDARQNMEKAQKRFEEVSRGGTVR